jgi:hypothetical protein
MAKKNIFLFEPPSLKQALTFNLLGMPVAYLLTGYFSSMYPGVFQFILLSLIIQTFCAAVILLFLKGNLEIKSFDFHTHLVSIFALTVVFTFAVFAAVIAWQFPSLFNHRLFIMDTARLPLFAGLIIFSTAATAVFAKTLEKKGIVNSFRTSSFYYVLRANLAGILLFALFFVAYFIFAQSLNFPDYYTRDQYFEADISDWIKRLTTSPDADLPTIRAVHPAVMLILRPLTWFISIGLNDKLQAVYILSALAGAGCVFLAWLIVKGQTGNSTYALMTASII